MDKEGKSAELKVQPAGTPEGKNSNHSIKPESSGPFIAETRLRVRYAETDAQGVVYHSNYVVWFEVGRVEYCRQIGYPYVEIEREGYGFMVTELSVKYLSPARFDDELIVRAWLEKVGRVSCLFAYQIYNETSGQINAEGMTAHAAVSFQGKIVPFSQKLYSCFSGKVGRGPSKYTLLK